MRLSALILSCFGAQYIKERERRQELKYEKQELIGSFFLCAFLIEGAWRKGARGGGTWQGQPTFPYSHAHVPLNNNNGLNFVVLCVEFVFT